MEISVVIPLFNEEESLGELMQQIHEALQSHRYEVLFVDDGSTDDSWNVIVDLTANYAQVRGISLGVN
ncbi:MAG: glycosyltransferase, partial [Bacteroidota bacterium]